ncbi:hypothetical protein D9757_001831 [Collybiopsis confluens]|uniref:Reverse transcriptase n=1 Tax=Collybiopsis confluens TaxID=2823264 RepID=A0A8H5HYG0_9AGAR|nr:hypothetical protein D9757_008772 [Collybiopsis confluens]KAF5391861.1 hypothetical protein D9757_001831 [Collybiopsis confluens]
MTDRSQTQQGSTQPPTEREKSESPLRNRARKKIRQDSEGNRVEKGREEVPERRAEEIEESMSGIQPRPIVGPKATQDPNLDPHPPANTPPWPSPAQRQEPARRGGEGNGNLSQEEDDGPVYGRIHVIPDGSLLDASTTFAMEFVNLPAHARGQNPHSQSNRQDLVQGPVSTPRPFTDANFPRTFFNREDSLAGWLKEQIETFNSHPELYLKVVPHGAGIKFYEDHPNFGAEVRQFIVGSTFGTEIAEEVYSELQVFRPTLPAQHPRDFWQFKKPWASIIKTDNRPIREWLLHQQTFAISPQLTFHVTAIDTPEHHHWVLGNFIIDTQQITEKLRLQCLATLMLAFWKDQNLRVRTEKIRKQGVQPRDNEVPNLDDIMLEATASWDLQVLRKGNPTEPGYDDPTTTLQLTGQPITTNDKDHKDWCAAIQKLKVFVNGDMKLTSAKTTVECAGCKSPSHYGHQCPFPKTDGWYGPRESRETAETQNQDGNQGKGRGRPPRSSRGGRPQRSREHTPLKIDYTREHRNRHRYGGLGQSRQNGNGAEGAGGASGPAAGQRSGDGTSVVGGGHGEGTRSPEWIPLPTLASSENNGSGDGMSHMYGMYGNPRNVDNLQNEGSSNSREPTQSTSQNVMNNQRGGDHNNDRASPAEVHPNRRQRRNFNKEYKKAGINIASLNVRGYGNPNIYHTDNRWRRLTTIMRDRRIAILAVQEAHLTEERSRDLNTAYNPRIKIWSSSDPENPTGKCGVAIAINKDLYKPTQVKKYEVVPGRAMILHLKGSQANRTIMVIYAPNLTGSNSKENSDFWTQVKLHLDQHPEIPKPEIMLGDMNMVEDGLIDRLPAHDDPENACGKLDDLKLLLGLKDGWRATNPEKLEYTYLQASTGSQSRIDRIYITESIAKTAREWRIRPSGLLHGDHSMVSAHLPHGHQAPNMGKGRWRIPDYVTKDKDFLEFAYKQGQAAQTKLENLQERSAESNPQRIWHKYKHDIRSKARKRAKEIIPGITRKINEVKSELDQKLNGLNDITKVEQAKHLQQKLNNLENLRLDMKRKNGQVKHRMEGEIPTRYWSQANKEQKPRDVMYILRKPGFRENENGVIPGDAYERDSERMAELAGKYHRALQYADIPPEEPERKNHILATLEPIKQCLSEEQEELMAREITTNDVRQALKLSKNNSAPGLDGIPYEVYKSIKLNADNKNKSGDNNGDEPKFEIETLMTAAYNDIVEFGIDETTTFSAGWMCPIYKKGNTDDIANYRPITLLNTDYKILTKALTLKLGKVAPSLIHPDQAGFIPGRNILDQTKLIQMIIDYAEVTEQNGMIISLDQEKAYDKIRHDYLWEVLRKFGFPEQFIKTIQHLYEPAKTKVAINGFYSREYHVTRGVRQGDPLSCLIFDLAIEPLAEAIRCSELKGYSIPGTCERIIANLFADDTTVFLKAEDNYETLTGTIEKWCLASGAKFNIAKTNVIPIGTPKYREEVKQTRKSSNQMPPLPSNIRITQDQEATRILGAWYGNNISAEQVWSPILEKIDTNLQRWARNSPTMEGRRHIIQMIIGGMTQYLSAAQGMPKSVEKKLEKRTRTYMWSEHKHNPISMKILHGAFGSGGRKVLDIAARNQAIDVMTLKTYLTFGPQRKQWAKIADELFSLQTPKSDGNTDRKTRINVFLQSWKTLQNNKQVPSLRKITSTAKKFRLRIEGIAFERDITHKMPIWMHKEASIDIRKMTNTLASKCLREKHNVRTVGDAERLANLGKENNHRQSSECDCITCIQMKTERQCPHPHGCIRQARKLLATLPPKWNPCSRLPEDYQNIDYAPGIFTKAEGWSKPDLKVTTTGELSEIFRIFTDGDSKPSNDLPKLEPPTWDPDENITVATDGSCNNNGEQNAKAGAGVFISEGHPDNRAIRLPNYLKNSNQTGELVGSQIAAITINPKLTLGLETDSMHVINTLKNAKKIEDEGYENTPNGELVRSVIASFRGRKTPMYVKWVKGHAGHERNEGADKMAREALEKNKVSFINLNPPNTLKITGAKLSKLTQSKAYKAIMNIKEKEKNKNSRRRTEISIMRVQNCVEDRFGYIPTQDRIWASIRNKDHDRKIRDFLWKVAHDAYWTGTHWLRASMPQTLQERAICKGCDEIEDMEHILTKCEMPGQRLLWELAEQLWKKKKSSFEWGKPAIGDIIGGGMARIYGKKKDKPHPGQNRLWKIIITETAYLIWTLRCKRVIEYEGARALPESEIQSSWIKMINNRLDLDCRMTRPSCGSKMISKRLVIATWQGTLHKEDSLPRDWTTIHGVLVGITGENNEGVG